MPMPPPSVGVPPLSRTGDEEVDDDEEETEGKPGGRNRGEKPPTDEDGVGLVKRAQSKFESALLPVPISGGRNTETSRLGIRRLETMVAKGAVCATLPLRLKIFIQSVTFSCACTTSSRTIRPMGTSQKSKS